MDEKKKALQMVMGQIEKQFGKGAVMKLGEIPHVNVDAIPTGSLTLDIALGVGGLPRGRIIEIYGPESSGKTTVALHVVAKHRSSVARLHLLMPSMHWTLYTLRNWELT